MKKYILIKTYPGSPKLGYIITTENYTSNGVIFLKCCDYPEFWEEVIEKEYEILSLARLCTIKPTITDVSNYGCGHIEAMLKCDNARIHSIKRLSDGEIFTVGDIVALNEGWGKKDCKIKSFRVKNNSLDFEIIQGNLSGWYGEFLNQSLNQWSKIKQPLFTTEQRSEIEEIIKNIIR